MLGGPGGRRPGHHVPSVWTMCVASTTPASESQRLGGARTGVPGPCPGHKGKSRFLVNLGVVVPGVGTGRDVDEMGFASPRSQGMVLAMLT